MQALVLGGLLGSGATVQAQDVSDATSPTLSQDAKTARVLDAAGSFYLGLQNFQVEGSSLQRSGAAASKHERGETFSLAMSRPASFAFVRSDSNVKGALVSDGETLTGYVLNEKLVSRPAPQELSKIIHPSTDFDLDIKVFGSYPIYEALLSQHPFRSLVKKMTGTYVGSEAVAGTQADHLHFAETTPTKARTLDLWFAEGPSPFLVQASQGFTAIFLPGVLDKPLPEGWSAPYSETILTFSNWRCDGTIPPERFQFQQPLYKPPLAPQDASSDPATQEARLKAEEEQMKIDQEELGLQQLWRKEIDSAKGG